MLTSVVDDETRIRRWKLALFALAVVSFTVILTDTFVLVRPVACVSLVPCHAYRGVFEHCYYIDVEGFGSYMLDRDDVPFIINTTVVNAGALHFAVRDVGRLHLDGSSGKLSNFGSMGFCVMVVRSAMLS